VPLETFVVDIIEGRKKSPFLKGIFFLLGKCFQSVSHLRNWGYDSRLIPIKKVALPVVSIGNITAGGTGKTPLIQILAQELEKKGNVAILTRGYRSKNSRTPICLKKGETCGDEPTWLSQNLAKTAIWVGKNRIQSSLLALKNGAEVLLLDDGMQHRALFRDVEIVVMDGEDPFGKGAFLPGGFLRDSPKRLQSADLIVVNHIYSREEYLKCQKLISVYTSAPVVGMHYRFKDEDKLRGKKIGAFCAIGRPERFITMLRRAGCDLVEYLIAPDHAPFSTKQLRAFAKRCESKGAEFLVCTEKDGVKLSPELETVIPTMTLPIEIHWVEGKKHWDECLGKILKKMD
jgi:tetraacyldisaccharide 4'-kinase